MPFRIFSTLVAAVILSSAIGFSQQGTAGASQQSSASPNKPKRNIELTITPMKYSEELFKQVETDRYKAGELVYIAATMVNRMPKATDVRIDIKNPFFQNRFNLLKDGKPVLQHKGNSKSIEDIGSDAAFVGTTFSYHLEANNAPFLIGYFPLNEWYGFLEPGHYELRVRHSFWGKEQPVESNIAAFDVVP